MQALCFPAQDQCSLRTDLPHPVAGPGEVVVRIAAAALNHRDLWIKKGQYAGIHYPVQPGSDGAGTVVATGPGIDTSWADRAVIINPAFTWGSTSSAQATDFTILGLPRPGTLAEFIAVPASQLALRPTHLNWNSAAALPLAGLTAYRALFTRAHLQAGEKILITGIGGGVALFALQFAVAAGAEVWVTSSDEQKLAQARNLGAAGGFNYTQPGWAQAATESGHSFAVIVDSAGGETFSSLIDLAAPGGRLVFYGATRGHPSGLALRKIFWRQLSLLGTTMGSPEDWAAMLRFVTLHRIQPVISATFPLSDTAAAFALMERGGQFGKIVITL